MNVTVNVKRTGKLDTLASRIHAGIEMGMESGGSGMAEAVEASANDLARYPTGELEASIQYEPISSGSVVVGRIVAGTDHAEPFLFGASVHFVPYAEADERIKAGLYPHIKPVYDESDTPDGHEPNGAFQFSMDAPINERVPIGYLVSSSEHPFMQEGFNATKDTLVQGIAYTVATIAEG